MENEAEDTTAVTYGDAPATPAELVEPLVVALGASAGGPAAVEAFLRALGPAPPFCLLLAQHLAPDAAEEAVQHFARRTGLPVAIASEGCPLLPGTLLLVVPGREVSFRSGRLRLRQPRRVSTPVGDGRLDPVDRLFRSVGEAFGPRAVGIVLSGTGVDGAMGLQAIGGAGGLAMAQTPETAAHSDMPEAAIASGFTDIVAPPAELAAALLAHEHHRRARIAAGSAGGEPAALRSAVVSHLPEICTILRAKTGHDFRHYKASTLVRRLERRLRVLRLDRVEDYLDRLNGDAQEPAAVFRELLIGVTSFFRDPDAFAMLAERAIDPLLAQRPASEPLRIWVAGCATGEEAYSVAMLVKERLDGLAAPPPVQIFATDVNERALATARRGVYPSTIAGSVSPSRLARFFTRRGRGWQVTEELRAMCLFSPHNLIADPPFSRLDLVCCRNLLIYFGAHLQKKLIPLFHYALRPGGFLFLGSSETLAGHAELFRPLDPRHRIAQRTAARGVVPPGSPSPRPPPRHAVEAASAPWQVGAAGVPLPGPDGDLGALAQRILLDEFGPAYAIVNAEGHAVYLSEKAGRFLQPPAGSFTSAVTRMARRGLGVGLRACLAEAARTRRTVVREGLSVQTGGGVQPVRLTAQPMPEMGRGEGLYMLVFEEAGPPIARPAQGSHGAPLPDAEAVIAQLERELHRTREDLERAVQDLEAANEELKASNEELLSMNEELQSSNEELETSKEEVQAANAALAAANADLANLMRATRIATVFLDRAGRLRGFTPAATEIYPIAVHDTGRPISHFRPHLLDAPPLPEPDALREAPGGIEHEIEAEDGRWLLRRVLPYRGIGDADDGLVVTFLDITRRKADELALLEGEARLRRAEAAGGIGLFDWDVVADRAIWSEGLYSLAGLPAGTAISLAGFLPLVHPDDHAEMTGGLARAAASGRYEAEFRIRHAGTGETRWIAARGDAVVDAEGRLLRIQGVNLDVTERRRAEAEREATEARARLALQAGGLVAWEIDPATGRMVAENGLAALFGIPEASLDGTIAPYLDRIHPEDRQGVLDALAPATRSGGIYRAEFRVRRSDGQERWLIGAAQGVAGPDGAPRTVGYNADVTEARAAEAALRSALAELDWLYDTAPVGLCLLDRDLRFRRINKLLAEVNGAAPEAHLGRTVREMLPALADQAEALLRRVIETGEPALGIEIAGETPARPGVRRVWEESWLPLRDANGAVAGVSVVATEITDRREAEAQMRLLMDELDHRVKNTLAIVQSLARQTQQATAADPDRFLGDFVPRLRALAASHDVLTGRGWKGVPLAQLLERTLAAYAAGTGDTLDGRVSLDGPEVLLAPGKVVGLGMVFHELATNAAKYGAFAKPAGRLRVQWRINAGAAPETREVLLEWIEAGGAAPAAPRPGGFGTRLIDRVVAHDLRGKVARELAPSGLTCAISFPLREQTASGE